MCKIATDEAATASDTLPDEATHQLAFSIPSSSTDFPTPEGLIRWLIVHCGESGEEEESDADEDMETASQARCRNIAQRHPAPLIYARPQASSRTFSVNRDSMLADVRDRSKRRHAVVDSVQRLLHDGPLRESQEAAICAAALSRQKLWEQGLHLIAKNDFLKETKGLNAAINTCRAGSQWEMALELGMEAVSTWDDITYSMILSACSKGSAWELALYFLKEAESSGLDAHEHVVSAAVAACGRAFQWQQALVIANGAGELAKDVAVLSASIDACRRAGNWEAALSVFGRLRMLGYTSEPGAGAAVSALANATRWIEALQLFQAEFQQAAGNPGIRSYEAALQACAQGNNWQIALSLLEEIECRQLPRDKRSFNTALSAYRRTMQKSPKPQLTFFGILDITCSKDRQAVGFGCFLVEQVPSCNSELRKLAMTGRSYIKRNLRQAAGDVRQILRLVEEAEKLPWPDKKELGDVYAVAMNAIGPLPLQTAPEEYGELCVKRLLVLCRVDPQEARTFNSFLAFYGIRQEDPRMQQALNALTRDSLASVVLGSPPMHGEKERIASESSRCSFTPLRPRNLSYSSCDTTKLEEAIAAVAANAFSEKEEGKLSESEHQGVAVPAVPRKMELLSRPETANDRSDEPSRRDFPRVSTAVDLSPIPEDREKAGMAPRGTDGSDFLEVQKAAGEISQGMPKIVVVNGVSYTRLQTIGRGGTSKVQLHPGRSPQFVSKMARRNILAVAFVAAVAAFALRWSSAAFLPASNKPMLRAGAMASAGALAASGAMPAMAEEGGGLLDFGKVELGGGFALNLNIPDINLINISILIAGLFYFLSPVLGESMASREKEIKSDIEDAIAKYNEATSRLAEAEKNKAQADQVVKEINDSIAKDGNDGGSGPFYHILYYFMISHQTNVEAILWESPPQTWTVEDIAEFQSNLKEQAKRKMEMQDKAQEKSLQDLQARTQENLEAFIDGQAVTRGLKEC
eukprot:s4185_g1.t1